MASNDSVEDAQKAVLAEVTKDHNLKHVEPPAESLATTQAKVLLGVQGKHELHHVEPPSEGLSDAEKQAYLEEKQQQQE